MQFNNVVIFGLLSGLAAADSSTTTTTEFITHTAHFHRSAATDSVVATSTASSDFDFSNKTSYRAAYNVTTPYNISSNDTSNGTNLYKRQAFPSELAPVVATYSGFANKLVSGYSVGALALIAGFML